jgi:hypothetical protein
MRISHLLENKELPGASEGILVMSPEEFVQADEEGIDVDPNEIDKVDEDKPQRDTNHTQQMINDYERRAKMASSDIRKQHFMKMAQKLRSKLPTSDLDEGVLSTVLSKLKSLVLRTLGKKVIKTNSDAQQFQRMMSKITSPVDTTQYARLWQEYKKDPSYYVSLPSEADLDNSEKMYMWSNSLVQFITNKFPNAPVEALSQAVLGITDFAVKEFKQNRRSELEEATKLPAQQREFGGQEFQDYMNRIVGTSDIDKKTGQVKVDKKGVEKYVSGKTKTDKYKLPYMHRSSVITYYDAAGKKFREEDVINALKVRPKALLKQNEKMKHSNGELEQFFNIGFAALTGIAVDESTGKLIIVNTCPGAGSCKVDCFAMKGGKVQFKNAWLSDGKILTYLLNDPDGFFDQLDREIKKEEKLGDKGGYTVTIRWHDAGDFFSPEYTDLAMKLAASNPDVMFYAYTKMSSVALKNKPANFMINWSEGASTAQEKPIKSADPELAMTKNSRIVPTDTFGDLLVKDEKGNLVKGREGQWQVEPDKLPELKQRLAKQYGLSANSILSYDEWESKGKKNPQMKWNVIITPGEPDITAKDPGVLSTLLLKH